MLKHDDGFWMRMAIDIAREGRTAFGAVIVDEEGNSIGDFNTTKLHGPTAHAEINAIRRMNELDYDDPRDLVLYTTVEPCPMCMSAIIWAGIGTVVYGASIDDAAKQRKQIMITSRQISDAAWYTIEIRGGVEHAQCLELLSNR